jgi:hypothetical protein
MPLPPLVASRPRRTHQPGRAARTTRRRVAGCVPRCRSTVRVLGKMVLIERLRRSGLLPSSQGVSGLATLPGKRWQHVHLESRRSELPRPEIWLRAQTRG